MIALLNLSSWCLVMVERLFLAVPRGCLQFVIVVFPDHTHLLFLKLKNVILTNSLRWLWNMSFYGFLEWVLTMNCRIQKMYYTQQTCICSSPDSQHPNNIHLHVEINV